MDPAARVALPNGRASDTSIPHVCRRGVVKLFGLCRIEFFQACILRLSALLALLFDEYETKIQVGSRIFPLQTDRRPQGLDRRRQTVQFVIRETQLGMRLNVLRL